MNGLYIKPSIKVLVVNTRRSFMILINSDGETYEQLSIRPGESASMELELEH